MIKKSLIAFLITFALFYIFWQIYTPGYTAPQTLMQDNQIIAQNYLYSDQNASSIIVGTSMSYTIITDKLTDFCNLGLKGGSPDTGMQLIEEKGVYPKRIFVEINSLFWNDGSFDDLTDGLYNPVFEKGRRILPSLRDGRQPILTVANKIQENILDTDQLTEFAYNTSHYDAKSIDVDDSLNVVARIKIHMSEPQPENVEKRLEAFDKHIKNMESHNVEIYFFEMPICKNLTNQARPVFTRKLIREKYPESKYTYLTDFRTKYPFKTFDTTHLGHDEAEIFTALFKAEVDSLIRIEKQEPLPEI